MERPETFYDGSNVAEIVPEIPAPPENQDEASAAFVPYPEIVRHHIPPSQGHHQRVDEGEEPGWIRFGGSELKNPDLRSSEAV